MRSIHIPILWSIFFIDVCLATIRFSDIDNHIIPVQKPIIIIPRTINYDNDCWNCSDDCCYLYDI